MSLPIGQIVEGDCFQVMGEFPVGSADLIILDPPYGLGTKTLQDSIDLESNIQLHKNLAKTALRILKGSGSIYLFLSYRLLPFILPTFLSAFQFRNLLIWHYGNANTREKRNYAHCYDPIAFLTKDDTYYFDADGIREPYETERVKYPVRKKGISWSPNPKGRLRKNIIRVASPRPAFSDEYVKHPWQKPIRLFTILIQASCPPSGLVIDPFIGSGTTAIAAQILGRKWIGVEIEPKYCEIARSRVKPYLAQKTLDE